MTVPAPGGSAATAPEPAEASFGRAPGGSAARLEPVEAAADQVLSRRAARVLLLDAAGRVLLLHGSDPGRPDEGYWFTVGGGLNPDETPIDGATRELFEETGLRLAPAELTGPVWHETTRFPFDGQWYSQDQDFFVARVASWEVDRSGFDEIERATIDATAWWTIDELERTGERFYPSSLPALLRSVSHGVV
jgi:8-oxo-dGTP pyrophosphatase MutT (NUDIX family)